MVWNIIGLVELEKGAHFLYRWNMALVRAVHQRHVHVETAFNDLSLVFFGGGNLGADCLWWIMMNENSTRRINDGCCVIA